jgi:tetratricopeptide (TPR) repeat protein
MTVVPRAFVLGFLATTLAVTISGCAATRVRIPLPEPATDLPLDVEIWRRPAPPEAVRLAYEEARRLVGLGRLADAVAALEPALAVQPAYLDAHRLLGDALLHTSADWWLHETYAKRLARYPKDADSYYLLARVEPDADQQLALYQGALARDPRHAYARLGLALSLARKGDMTSALAETRRSAETAPWLGLPWLYLGGEALRRGEPVAAAHYYAEARDRASDDARSWLGIAQSSDDLGQLAEASRAALHALRLAPAQFATSEPAVDVVVRGGVPGDLAAAIDVVSDAEQSGAPKGPICALRGKLLLARGDVGAAESAFADAIRGGVSAAELAHPLRIARVLGGRVKDAVIGNLGSLPREAFAKENLYAPRWERLRRAALSLDANDARSLLGMSEAMASVGWLAESRIVLARARAIAPDDRVIAARAAAEDAFAVFVQELGAVGRQVGEHSPSGTTSTAQEVLDRVAEVSRKRLGRDITRGAVVRSYAMLGEFAASVASTGEFETTFGSHGLVCLIGARSGEPAELLIGRAVLVRGSVKEPCRGADTMVDFDEVWLESEGLPRDVAGLRRGLAGVTLDRLVFLQLDVIRRTPRSPVEGVPFVLRQAKTVAELRSLDTPSDVAGRMEARLAARGVLDDAILDTVRRHELVHVADAMRLLPISDHLPTVLWFGLSHGFDGEATEKALESRAQTLSIQDVREPMASLAGLLAFLPGGGGDTVHAAGYRETAQRAVDLIIEDPRSFPSIDLRYNVLQQMDLLTDGEIRELSRRLTREL